MKKALFFPLQLSLCTVGYLYASSNISQAQQRDLTWRGNIAVTLAQVTTDGTLDTQVNQNNNVAEITGGENRGGNLFHSFQDFSVGTGNEAFFNNASDISNIFSRVTGGNISNINGAIRANGSASLFLINPAGIIFGENARLDIGGSFYGSSASSILFEDGEFSAADLENPPLLTVNAPIGLGFRDNPGEITHRSRFDNAGLQVVAGEDIALLGGDINLEGGLITASEGKITLGGLNTTGTINVTETNSFTFPEEISNKSNVFLTQQAGVDVRGAVGGSIQVNANNLEILEDSNFLAGIPINSGTPDVQSGDINFDLNNLIARQDAEIRNETLGIGNAGNINIVTGKLDFTEGSAIVASTFGQGNAGNVNINATGDVSFDRDFGGINTNVGLQRNDTVIEDAVGNAGNISIEGKSLSLTNGARLVSKTSGLGNSGNINVSVSDDVFVDGEGFTPITVNDFTFVFTSGIFTQATPNGLGNAGNITVDARNFRLDNKAIIAADSSSVGDAGKIVINTEENTVLGSGTLLLTQIQGTGEGQGGEITLTSQNLDMVNALVSSDTNNKGNAGDIKINVTENLTMQDENKINSQLNPNATGNAGNIEINVGNQFLIKDNTIISTSAEPNAVGNAGNIEINTGFQTITDSIIIADSQAQGSAGDIKITAEENIILQSTSEGSSSRIVTGLDRSINDETGVVESVGEGNAGNINLAANQINIDDGAFVISDIEGIASGGGEINLNTDILRVENNSFVSTFTITESNAGSINVVGDTLILESGGKLITSTDGEGNAGTINLSVSDQIIIDNGKSPSIPKIQFEDPVLNELQNRTGLFVNATERAIGNGGDIFIQRRSSFPTNNLKILNGAEVSADGAFEGDAGNIFISVKSMELNNDASVVAKTFSENGGNINLAVDRTITLNNNSLISAEAESSGNGGNINIDTNFIIAFPSGNNDILANAEQGNGGNININAESLFGIQERALSSQTNDINASSRFSLDGTINISTPDLNPVQGATELPTNVVEPEETTQQACQTNREVAAKNSFTINGKGGTLPDPALPLNSLNVTVSAETNPTSTVPAPLETSQGKIQPARGVEISESGEVILTAYRTNNSGGHIPDNSANCNRI